MEATETLAQIAYTVFGFTWGVVLTVGFTRFWRTRALCQRLPKKKRHHHGHSAV